MVAGIGAYVRLTAKYGNHSFAINMPGGLPVGPVGQVVWADDSREAHRGSALARCIPNRSCPAPGSRWLLQVEDTGAFEIMAPVYDVDIRNTQTRTLRVGLVGGLCRYALGKPQLQFTAYQCEDQSGQRPVRACFAWGGPALGLVWRYRPSCTGVEHGG